MTHCNLDEKHRTHILSYICLVSDQLHGVTVEILCIGYLEEIDLLSEHVL